MDEPIETPRICRQNDLRIITFIKYDFKEKMTYATKDGEAIIISAGGITGARRVLWGNA
ncbi:MAG: hypothetical protein LBL46_02625 [Rickettsiales bacterium]|jgi:hypothetical protein|nr:hypothetical protein [Rickettsiales bacterium]